MPAKSVPVPSTFSRLVAEVKARLATTLGVVAGVLGVLGTTQHFLPSSLTPILVAVGGALVVAERIGQAVEKRL